VFLRPVIQRNTESVDHHCIAMHVESRVPKPEASVHERLAVSVRIADYVHPEDLKISESITKPSARPI
jgi:hypothetical protein